MPCIREFVMLFTISALLSALVSAQVVEINIPQILTGKISSLVYDPDVEGGPLMLSAEFFNSGSVGYKARARLDMFLGQGQTTVWSRESVMTPGMRNIFRMFWYDPNVTGGVTGRLRIYFGNEVVEQNISFARREANPPPEDVFSISDLRTYEDRVKLSIKSAKDVDNVVIYASGYPLGWMFEQAEIRHLDSGDKVSVEIPYTPSLWIPTEVSLTAFTQDGVYYSASAFPMAREDGLSKYVHYITDWIRTTFNF